LGEGKGDICAKLLEIAIKTKERKCLYTFSEGEQTYPGLSFEQDIGTKHTLGLSARDGGFQT
jgi:hypothetical protein